MSGTSSAAALIAGEAALVRQYFSDGFFPAGAATPGAGFAPSAALLKAVLINSASPIARARFDAAFGGASSPADLLGAGGLGVPNLHGLDVFAPEFAELATQFAPTHVLLPDVLEHLHEPVAFVRRLAQVMPQVPLVVSVPNGLSLRNVWNSLAQVERINTDHLCWYSPFTVAKVLSRGGYTPELWWSSQIAPAASPKGRVLSAMAAWRPLWADNILVLSRPA
jgi:hypothetical protein